MSGILRSGKFVRCFASAARTFLSPQVHGVQGAEAQSVATRPLSVGVGISPSWNKIGTHQQTDSIEPLLQRLDADVRKFGRLSRKDLDDMLEEIRQKHYVSSSQSLLIIRCCGDLVPEELPEVRTKLVKEIWNTLMERGVPMDISHYNALLRVYIENEHTFSPEDFLKELEAKGIEPNRVTYQRLMWRYCQHGDVEGASRILELMRSNHLPLSSAVLDALVLGHARMGDAAGAHAVVSAMGSAGLEPGPRTYALLAGCSGARGDTEELKKTLKECAEKEIYLSDKDIMDIIEDCAVGGHEENIDFLLGQMQHSAGYNTDAVTLILRLITLGRDKAALQVFKSLTKPANPISESDSSHYQGAFFIKQLIKAGRPKDVVLSMCQELQADGSIPKAYNIATFTALQTGNQDLALDLFGIMKDTGETIKQHYFWPLLVALGKAKKNTEMLSLLETMSSEVGIGVSAETLREYVIPYFKNTDPNTLFDQLREHNVPFMIAGKMIVNWLLAENNLNKAAQFTVKYGITNNLAMCRNQLIQSLHSIDDVNSFVKILHSGIGGESPKGSQSATEMEENSGDGVIDATPTQGYKSTVGSIVMRFVSNSQSTSLEILIPLLESLHSYGIGITVHWAEKIQDQLGGSMTNVISESLAKLTADDLELKSFQPSTFSMQRTPESLERLISNIEAKGEQVFGLKKKLLLAYMSYKQTDKLEQYIQKLIEDNFAFSAGLHVLIQDYYVHENNVAKALIYYNKIVENDPNFVIDDFKIIKLVNLLVSSDEYEKGLEIMKIHPGSKESYNHTFIFKSFTWRILNTVAEMGDVQKLDTLFNIMMEKNYIKESSQLLGSLVKVHLVKDDIQSALNEFERICTKYQMTPIKNELTKRLISLEDAAGLQKLTDLSTSVHGEVNSLYDLVFGFVECGRVRQARRILETPGMRTRNQRFNSACERYAQEGKVDYLEGLLEATRELSHIDRSEVFQQLLNAYIKEGNLDKGLGLWTLLQEEGEAPTDKFLADLASFLKSNNRDVPFVVPEKYIEEMTQRSKVVEKQDVQSQSKDIRIKNNTNEQSLFNALQNNKLEEAISIWRKTSIPVTKAEVTLLLEELVKQDRRDIATEVLLSSYQRNVYPHLRVVRFLLNSLAQSGDLKNMNSVGEVLSPEQRSLTSFDNKKCNAIVNSGGLEELLEEMVKKIDSSTDEDIEKLRQDFPAGGFLGMLADRPDHSPRYTELVEKYNSKGIVTPANIMWIHYIVSGNDSNAHSIWNKYLADSHHILFKKVLAEAKSKNDPELIEKVLHYLKSSTSVSKTALGVVYSAKIDLLLKFGKVQESERALEEAISEGCSMEDINKTALTRLKKYVEDDGQQFKYQIPTRKNSN